MRYTLLTALLFSAACSPAVVRYPGPLGSVGSDPAAPLPEVEPAQTVAEALTRTTRRSQRREGDSVARAAAYYVGRYPLVCSGETYRYDCSGLVEAVYARAGQPVSGSTRELYERSIDLGVAHRDKIPSPGDLAFFDDTYDRNGNGRLDDDLSHVAVVESVDADGTITLVHKGSKGVTRIYMNLSRPDVHSEGGETLNSYLRAQRRQDPRGTEYLAGELWRGFSSLWAADGAIAMEF